LANLETSTLVLNLILYVILPLWGLSGLADWMCHRATHIESTSGLRESVLHSVMGIQVGIPIVLCVLYDVNVTVYLLCLLALVLHEVVAHLDVSTAAPLREISIWEVHAHNFLATIPFYSFALISVLRWDTVMALLRLDFSGWGFHRHPVPVGGPTFLPLYLTFMAVVCVFPYVEELWRCYRRSGAQHA
jgi:hypothetical protein